MREISLLLRLRKVSFFRPWMSFLPIVPTMLMLASRWTRLVRSPTDFGSSLSRFLLTVRFCRCVRFLKLQGELLKEEERVIYLNMSGWSDCSLLLSSDRILSWWLADRASWARLSS